MGVALRDILVDYKTAVNWESLPGVAAVDAHNALYQFLSIIRQPDGTPLMDRTGRITSHLSGIFFRNLNFIEKGIRPVYVFDGSPPEFKSVTISQRRKVRAEAGEKWSEALRKGDIAEAYKHARSSSRIDTNVLETSKNLLDLMGIPSVQAPSEGEAQAACMVKQGGAAYVVSQDYDTLLFGGPVLVRNLTVSGRRKVHGRMMAMNPEKILLTDILQGLSLTREQLVEIGILVGTDFNPGVEGIGPKKGLKIVQNCEFDAFIREKLPGFDPSPIKDFFLNPPATSQYDLQWKPPETEKIVKMLCDEYDFSEERVRKALEVLAKESKQKTLDAWF